MEVVLEHGTVDAVMSHQLLSLGGQRLGLGIKGGRLGLRQERPDLAEHRRWHAGVRGQRSLAPAARRVDEVRQAGQRHQQSHERHRGGQSIAPFAAKLAKEGAIGGPIGPRSDLRELGHPPRLDLSTERLIGPRLRCDRPANQAGFV